MQGSVCVNERCGYRQKGEHRNCPRCGWLMLDGPLPEVGSIAPPPRVLNVKAIGAGVGAAAVLFLGGIGMIAGSFASADPVAAHSQTIAAAPIATPAVATETFAPAPAVAPAPVAVAAAAPASVAKKTVAKAPAKSTAKKPVAKKAPAKKTTKKSSTKVARR